MEADPVGTSAPPACPRCGGSDVVAIRYGALAAREGPRVLQGGCSVGASSPRWGCTTCGNRWGRRPALPDVVEPDPADRLDEDVSD